HFEPHSRQLAGFGDRFSLALVDPNAVGPEQLKGLAYDVCMYEQMGCLSPQAILLLTDQWEAVENFCNAFADAMAKMSEQLPVGRRTPAQHAAVQQWRGALAARRAAGEKIILLRSGGTEWTVAAAEHVDLNERVACRFARVWPIASLPNAMSILHRFERQLQSLATSLTLEETESFVLQFTGIDSPCKHIQITSPGLMQKPIFGWMDNDASWFEVTRALIA
ncbi:MAG: hypothetical protein ONA90_02465, partial [candidate division KSB1 bacterium]|nr:hypothetical protein [candidate division KSB1 bacterium]